MVGDAEITNRTGGYSPDAIGGLVLSPDQLAAFRHFAAPENGPAAMLHRRFRDIGVVVVMLLRLASPRQCPGEFPAGRNLARVKKARRPAFLIDAGFELLRIFEMSPAALQRDLARRIPGQAQRGRIQRSRLDVPAVLVRLSRVETADFDLEPVEHQSSGDHSKGDV